VHLQGVHDVTVSGNDLRGSLPFCVRESTGLNDANQPVTADYNTVTGNNCTGAGAVVADPGSHDTVSGNTL
jgi:hypothetical protein